MLTARTLFIALALTGAGVLVTSPATAIPYGNTPLSINLGTGIVAERYARTCGYWQIYGNGCAGWRVTGMAVPPELLDRAILFASTRGGRIVLAHANGIAFTDDRGAHWQTGRWEVSQGPLSVAFDAGSDFGVAVGPNGAVLTTDDRGTTWRSRRDEAGRTLVDVAVIGHTIAFTDDHGGVWISTDGGTSVRTLVDPATAGAAPMPRMTIHDRAIWVLVGGSVWWRADASANVERVDHPPGHE